MSLLGELLKYEISDNPPAIPAISAIPEQQGTRTSRANSKNSKNSNEPEVETDVPLSAKLRALGQPIALEVDGEAVCWLVSDEDTQRRTDLNPRITGEEAELLAQFSGAEIRQLLDHKARYGGTINHCDMEPPAPVSVHCIDCKHFVRKDHPHLGYCAAGVKPEGAAGLWDTDKRMCRRFEPKENQE